MSDKKVSNSLLALSSAAVLAVYSAGYVRTRAAAERFAEQTEARVRPAFAVAASGIGAAPAATTTTNTPAHYRDAPAPITTKPQPEKRLRRKQTVEVIAPDAAASTAVAAPAAPSAPAPSVPQAPPAPALSAPTAPAAPSAVDTPSAPPAVQQWRDGTYFGWGTSRHGDIQAQVVIEGGRIASATIAQCLTRYSCSVIAKLPPQVAERQSPDVDYVSGATQSADAFYYAVVEALSKAK